MTGSSSGVFDPNSTPTPPRRRPENMALIYENVFTVIVRLRSNRQEVASPEIFRNNMKAVLKKAEQDAARRNYAVEDASLATFAVVTFLDESILNLHNPNFASWARRPLLHELYADNPKGGEEFFDQIEDLLARRDSEELADLLEVYYLCLLLGYKGRYAYSEAEELRKIFDEVGEKIRQFRGASLPLAPSWAPRLDAAPIQRSDPWLARLVYAGVGSFLLAVLLFLGFKFLLHAGISDLAGIASR